MRLGTRTRRQHQHFKGQNYQLWNLTFTTNNLKPAHYNKIKQQTSAVTSQICEGSLTHVLQAIEAGTDTAFTKPTLTSAELTAQIIFKIEEEVYSKDKRTYDNNKTKLAQSLISQCELPVIDQLKDMKGHGTGQYDVLWVLSALNQMCSGIRNNQILLIQVFNAIRKVFTCKQQDNHSVPAFKDEFVQHVHAMKAVSATITLPVACLESEANLDPDKTLTDEVKQTRAFEHLMALTYLNQCDNSAESTRAMLKTQYVQEHDEYPANITVAANLVKAAKKDSRPNHGSHPALTLAQRAARSTYNPSPERVCLLCGTPDHWQRECLNNVHNGGALQPVATVSIDRIVSLAQNNSITLSDSLILLDSCSMCSIFKSRYLLCNVDHFSTKGHSSGVTIVPKVGSMACSQVGKLPGLSFPVWYHPDSIASIVSLVEMICERRITIDSDVENTLLLHAHDGRVLQSVVCGGGLFLHMI